MLKKHLKIQQSKQVVVWDGIYDNIIHAITSAKVVQVQFI